MFARKVLRLNALVHVAIGRARNERHWRTARRCAEQQVVPEREAAATQRLRVPRRLPVQPGAGLGRRRGRSVELC
jgi:hypothetical protein